MKHKVIAVALSLTLALSSTTAMAAEKMNTSKGCFDFNNYLENYIKSYSNSNSNLNIKKVIINGQSVDWESLFKTNTTKPSDTNINKTESDKNKPVVKVPNIAKPQVTKPEVVKPETTKPENNYKPNIQEPTNNSVSSSNLNYEQKVVELVNIERQKNGLSQLALNSSVSNVAMTKSKDMASNNYFAHQSPTYGSAGDMLTKFGVKWSAWGENIASGQRSPEAVVKAWMNSSGHRANILSSNFTKIGVGYATNANGTPYWTQIFTK